MHITDQNKKQEKRWLATFADLITLLLTFFVILLAMANIDNKRFEQAIDSLREARGIPPSFQGITEVKLDSVKKDIQLKNEPSSLDKADSTIRQSIDVKLDLQNMMKKLKQIIHKNKLGAEVSLEGSRQGIRLRVKGKMLYESGATSMKENAKRFIDGIADALKMNNFYLLVEGHTDSLPITTPKYPSNWELSSARATSVIRYLIAAGINTKRLSAIGYADNYPLVPNTSTESLFLNRRVEFVFTLHPTRVVI